MQVGCLVTQDVHTDCSEQARTRGIPQRLVERYGENLGGNQHHRAELQASQLSQASKRAINPVGAEPRNFLPVQEAAQHLAVVLLLRDKKFE